LLITSSVKYIKERYCCQFEINLEKIGLGEASSIAIAKARGFFFACDDRTARREAGLLGVKLTGTFGILKKAVRNRIIRLKEGNLILAEMIEKGFYSSVSSLREI